jgi:hypothetical protein
MMHPKEGSEPTEQSSGSYMGAPKERSAHHSWVFITICVCICIAAVIVGFKFYFVPTPYDGPYAAMVNRLHQGMSRNEVFQTLGEPLEQGSGKVFSQVVKVGDHLEVHYENRYQDYGNPTLDQLILHFSATGNYGGVTSPSMNDPLLDWCYQGKCHKFK